LPKLKKGNKEEGKSHGMVEACVEGRATVHVAKDVVHSTLDKKVVFATDFPIPLLFDSTPSNQRRVERPPDKHGALLQHP